MRQFVFISAGLSLIATPTIATAQQAGQLIAADPVVDTPGGMQAWRVRYWTTDGAGRPREVTGMVVAPREAIPAQPRRVLAWTHGTWGIASRCAPSLSPNFWSVTPALEAVKSGHVVVAPDYAGLGSAGMHPFLVGVDTGRSVIDGVRAARQIPGAAAGGRYAVWGESQGGHAALWTAQIARTYAPDLELVGAAAAAPPTDLIENLRQSPNKTVRTFFTAYIGRSWSVHYSAPMATFGGPQTRQIMTRLADNNCIELHSKPKLGTILGIVTLQGRLKNVDLGRVQPWANLARRNSPSTGRIGVPLLIAQNAKDDLVAPTVTAAHIRALCRSGNRVRRIAINGSGHATSAKDSTRETLEWIGNRFAGTTPRNDCGRS
ncbi:MAG: lipase family protein [Pseudomonadota bacterium]